MGVCHLPLDDVFAHKLFNNERLHSVQSKQYKQTTKQQSTNKHAHS